MLNKILIILLLMSGVVYAQDATINGYDYTSAEMLEFNGITGSPSVSTTGKAKTYFDTTSGKLKCSENGGAYADCVGGGGGGSSQWTTTGSDIYYNTGNVAVGSTIVGSKLVVRNPSGVENLLRIQSEAGTDPINTIINSQGYWGIGASPAASTHFYIKAVNGYNPFKVDSNSSSTTIGSGNVLVSSNSNTTDGNYVGLNLGLSNIGSKYTDTRTKSQLEFSTYNGASNVTAMTIRDGNVGIGSTAPSKTLDVTGSIRASTDIQVGSTSVCRSDGTNCPASSGSPGGSTKNVQYNSAGSFAGSNNFVFDGTNVGIGTILPLGRMQVSTPSTVPFIISTNGNVGIGTMAASGLLHLSGSNAANIRLNNTAASGNTYEIRSSIFNYSNSGFEIFNSTANRNELSIDNSGNVGIGTVTPLGALVVTRGNVGIGTATPLHLLSVQAAASGVAMILRDKSDPGGSQGLSILLNSKGNGTVAEDNLVTLSSTGASTGSLALGAGSSEVLRAANTGNVGIGTFNPNTKLHVGAGNASLAAFNTVSFGTGTPAILATNTSGIASIGAVVSDGTNNPRVNLFVDQTNFSWGLKNDFSSFTGSPFIIATGSGATEKMRIDYNGNVGLGTVNPQGRLQVGSIASTPFLIDSSGNVGIGTTAPLSVFQVGPGSGSGNVGIGSVNPTAALDIGGSGNIKVGGLGGSSGDILCRKADKTIGVCATSISGVGCTACN